MKKFFLVHITLFSFAFSQTFWASFSLFSHPLNENIPQYPVIYPFVFLLELGHLLDSTISLKESSSVLRPDFWFLISLLPNKHIFLDLLLALELACSKVKSSTFLIRYISIFKIFVFTFVCLFGWLVGGMLVSHCSFFLFKTEIFLII